MCSALFCISRPHQTFPYNISNAMHSSDCCVGLQNFIAIAIFIGDGLYNFLKIGILSLQVLNASSCSDMFCLRLASCPHLSSAGLWIEALWLLTSASYMSRH